MRIPRINQSKQNSIANENKKKRIKLQTIIRLWNELSERKGMLIFVLFLVVVNAALGIAGPFMIGYAIDTFINARQTEGLFILLAALLTIYFFYSITAFLQNFWMVGIAQKTVYKMRSKLFDQFQSLPIAFFDKRQHGELMSRVTNDMDNVSSTLNSSVIQVFSSVLILSGTIIVMIILSPLLTAVTLVIVPLMFYGMRWITARTGKLFKEQRKHLGDLNGFIEETISGQKIIKTYSQEAAVMDEFLEKSEKLRTAGYWAQTYSGFIPKLMNMLNNLSFALIAFVGGVFAINGFGGVTIGMMVTFTEYSRQFTRPLNELANQFNTLLSAIAGAERVFDILDTKKEDIDEKNAQEVQIQGDVKFSNVSFSYEEEDNTIKNISFHAAKGDTVALVGPTGAGKTTIINLLTRFYDAETGIISIDGHDIQSISRNSLRNSIGFVLQDVFLFEGTIKDNIRYGRLSANDEEVIEAAKLANAHSFILKLPGGYDTMIGQDGSSISQGQRQLLSIARAVLRNPSILILDEATSSIDTITEIKIQEALETLMKGRTTFIIAHRLNTIRKANQILVLSNGSIIEQGNHDELINRKGFYYELYQSKSEHSVS